MAMHLQPMRIWEKAEEGMDEKVISQIRRGELVEVPQGGDEPSKFLYKDLGGHTYWVSLMPFELEESDD